VFSGAHAQTYSSLRHRFLLVAEASLRKRSATPSMSGGLAQMLLGLVGILALLVGSLWLLKKLTQQRGRGRRADADRRRHRGRRT
jgi:hypothetical protein